MENFLFNDFEKLSPTAWKQKIQVDLKGADYNDTLLWKSNEGITVKPFYTEEDRNNLSLLLPKEGFKICQSIFVDDVKIANRLALDAISRGANSIQFTANKSFDYKSLFENIDLNKIYMYLSLQFLDARFVKELRKKYPQKSIYTQIDIIGNLAKTGNWFSSLKDDISEVEKFVNTYDNSICVDASLYQNAGANIAQELAYALAQTNEYLEIFGKEVAKKIHYIFSVGSNYFFEIAKLRAFRLLHESLLNEYSVQNHQAHIFTIPTQRNKTIYDYNVNMLRTTSECMSAILGGSNAISNSSYDSLYHKSNEFGERISRNQLLILQKETYLSKSQNFANGSYYIESIEIQLVEKALDIFKQIEKSGGFLTQLKKGNIQKKIKESADKEQSKFNNNEILLLGTNKLPNKNDLMRGQLELYPFLKTNNSKTLIPPIFKRRLSEEYEQNRLESELS